MRTRQKADPELVEEVYKRLGAWSLGPDREIDSRVCYAVGYDWTQPGVDGTWREHVEKHGYTGAWLTDHVHSGADLPEVTGSLDAGWDLLMDLMPNTDHVSLSMAGPGFGAETGVWQLSPPDNIRIVFKAKESHYDPVYALLAATLKGLTLRLEKDDW